MMWRAAIAAVVVGGVVLAPPAGADDVQGYLDALHSRGIGANSGDGGLVRAGMQVCDMIGSGMTPMATAMQVYRDTDASIDAEDAGFIVGAAIAGLCPEYVSLVR